MAKHLFFKLIHYYAYYAIVIDNCHSEKKNALKFPGRGAYCNLS